MCFVGPFVIVFAALVLAACWIFSDLSLRAKLIATGVYVGTWIVDYIAPGLGNIFQFFFSLALYFITFGPPKGNRWRP